MGTKIIVVLLAVQTVAIGLLTYALLDISQKFGSINAAFMAIEAAENSAIADATQNSGVISNQLTEARLRRILTEEINAGLSGVAQSHLSASPEATIGVPERRDQLEQFEQLEQVAGEIEYHISVGSISRTDMESLQAKIATLDPAERKRMLNKLVSAMNAGLIDGRF